ncbi:hypothetical protein BDV23DRAFT_143688, partial [Aspergillus alliaceus]
MQKPNWCFIHWPDSWNLTFYLFFLFLFHGGVEDGGRISPGINREKNKHNCLKATERRADYPDVGSAWFAL